MQKPRALRPFATLGLIAPSGATRVEGALESAAFKLKSQGYTVRLGESCRQRYGYLAGSDEARARDLNAMFLDDTVDAIFCVKGGYGAARILDRVDFDAIRAHPKIFVGYSDITALHIAIGQETGLVTFHGPMPVSDMASCAFDYFSHQSFIDALMNGAPREIKNPAGFALETLVPGVARGQLVGGNLTLITHSMGTPWQMDARDKILFLEDIGERTYRVDEMLTTLRLSGVLEACAGVVLGDFSDCTPEHEGDFTLREVFEQLLAPLGKPVLMGLRAGHCKPKLTLPLGVPCELDAGNRRLTLLEGAVIP